MEEWEYELGYYLTRIQVIQSVRNIIPASGNDIVPNSGPKTIIELPKNFTVGSIVEIFKPQLSLKQAALFLYYLRELKVIPYYTDESLGQIAKVLFARNEQNVREKVGEIYQIRTDNKELKKLKEMVAVLLSEIEKDEKGTSAKTLK